MAITSKGQKKKPLLQGFFMRNGSLFRGKQDCGFLG